MPAIPGLKRWRQGDQGLKINLNYTGNVRPAWATVRLYQLEKRRLGDVLVCFLLCLNFSCDKNQWPKSTRERKAYFSLQLEVAIHHWEKSGQEFKTGYRGQERKQNPWRSAAGWVAPHGLFSLFFFLYIQPRTIRPRIGTTYNRQGLLMDMPQASFSAQFLSWVSLFSGDTRLCQVDNRN